MTAKLHASPDNMLARTGQGRSTRGRKGPRGYGAMRDAPLNLDPRIDLTQPIYEQVLALQKVDKEAAGTE